MSRSRVRDYFEEVKSIVTRSGCSNDWHALKFLPEDADQGMVYADSLEFSDGATLRFIEDIAIGSDGSVERSHYGYHYESSQDGATFFFRYDRDPVRAQLPEHPECHLHVNCLCDSRGEELRFGTHPTSFAEVFKFIHVCFYSGTYPQPSAVLTGLHPS